MSVSSSSSPSTPQQPCECSSNCTAPKRKRLDRAEAHKMRAAGTDDSIVPVMQALGERTKTAEENEIRLLLEEVRGLRAKNDELTKKLEVEASATRALVERSQTVMQDICREVAVVAQLMNRSAIKFEETQSLLSHRGDILLKLYKFTMNREGMRCCVCYYPEELNNIDSAKRLMKIAPCSETGGGAPHWICLRCYSRLPDKLSEDGDKTTAHKNCPLCRSKITGLTECPLFLNNPGVMFSPPSDTTEADIVNFIYNSRSTALVAPENDALRSIITDLAYFRVLFNITLEKYTPVSQGLITTAYYAHYERYQERFVPGADSENEGAVQNVQTVPPPASPSLMQRIFGPSAPAVLRQ